MLVPEVAVIPVEQYHHRVCAPIVSAGDYVKTGGVIARSSDKRVPPVHSSVSGTVKEIADRPHPFGHRVKSVIIESDGKDTWVDLSTDGEIQDIILEKGIVETYDIHRPLLTKGTDTVILNGTDHQPYVFVDYVSVYGASTNGALRVRIGTSFKEVIAAVGGYGQEPRRIIMNSPMTGIAQYTDQVPVIKATYALMVQYATPCQPPPKHAGPLCQEKQVSRVQRLPPLCLHRVRLLPLFMPFKDILSIWTWPKLFQILHHVVYYLCEFVTL